jgi:adenosylcobyric acid synthase
MVQGTSSSAGKSLLTAALCRIFARKGVRVAPFKAQNMSNNAAVCRDGAEIGRAQAVQAAAAGIEPIADLNPVLLKPEAGSRSQVIVLGRPWQTLKAGSYYRRNKEELWPIVTAALDRLRSAYELVVIEGAGSPAELNLRSFDIVNMAVARYARAPVLLVGDIDRGGIFAQLLGTLWLLPPEERELVRGLVVNKFRGDPSLFTDGVRILQERGGGVPVLGVVPYLPALSVPEEDAVALEGPARPIDPARSIDIAVIRLPHIANFDDFDALRGDGGGVRLRYVHSRAGLGRPHAVILPGTKSTIADLAWLRAEGLDEPIRALAARGRQSSASVAAIKCWVGRSATPGTSSRPALRRRGSGCCRSRHPSSPPRPPSRSGRECSAVARAGWRPRPGRRWKATRSTWAGPVAGTPGCKVCIATGPPPLTTAPMGRPARMVASGGVICTGSLPTPP